MDRLGVFLAGSGNQVVTVDVSAEAVAATCELAREHGAKGNLTALAYSIEDVTLDRESFDVVISKRALHHMDLARTVERIYEWLVTGGVFLAEEPVCLLLALEWAHRRLPFHPSARTPDERELTERDLALIRRTFRQVRVSYFDFLTRESVTYFLWKARMDWLLNPLGRVDYLLINRGMPFLRRASTYAIVEATK